MDGGNESDDLLLCCCYFHACPSNTDISPHSNALHSPLTFAAADGGSGGVLLFLFAVAPAVRKRRRHSADRCPHYTRTLAHSLEARPASPPLLWLPESLRELCGKIAQQQGRWSAQLGCEMTSSLSAQCRRQTQPPPPSTIIGHPLRIPQTLCATKQHKLRKEHVAAAPAGRLESAVE